MPLSAQACTAIADACAAAADTLRRFFRVRGGVNAIDELMPEARRARPVSRPGRRGRQRLPPGPLPPPGPHPARRPGPLAGPAAGRAGPLRRDPELLRLARRPGRPVLHERPRRLARPLAGEVAPD